MLSGDNLPSIHGYLIPSRNISCRTFGLQHIFIPPALWGCWVCFGCDSFSNMIFDILLFRSWIRGGVRSMKTCSCISHVCHVFLRHDAAEVTHFTFLTGFGPRQRWTHGLNHHSQLDLQYSILSSQAGLQFAWDIWSKVQRWIPETVLGWSAVGCLCL